MKIRRPPFSLWEAVLILAAGFLIFQIVSFLAGKLAHGDDALYAYPRAAPSVYRIETARGRPISFRDTPACADADVRTLLTRRLSEIDLVELTATGIAMRMSDGRRVVSAGGMRGVGRGRGFFDARNRVTFYFRVDDGTLFAAAMLRDARTCAVAWSGPVTPETP